MDQGCSMPLNNIHLNTNVPINTHIFFQLKITPQYTFLFPKKLKKIITEQKNGINCRATKSYCTTPAIGPSFCIPFASFGSQ